MKRPERNKDDSKETFEREEMNTFSLMILKKQLQSAGKDIRRTAPILYGWQMRSAGIIFCLIWIMT